MKTINHLTLGAVFAATACIALAGPLPPPPAGYKIVQNPGTEAMKAEGTADGIDAVKPNDNWPKCFGDQDIHLSYGWRASSGSSGPQVFVDFMAKGPEDQATTMGRTVNEPAGKKTYLGGVLIWRKITTQAVGCTHAPIVTYNGSWMGAVSGKLVSVSAFHVLGSPDAGQALIDDYVTKMKAALGAAK
jgi:hypothetical protein